MQMPLFLIPQPKYLRLHKGAAGLLRLDGRVASPIDNPVLETAVRQVFGQKGRLVVDQREAPVRCRIVTPREYGLRPMSHEYGAHSEAFCLEIDSTTITLDARNPTGLRYGLITLGQIMRACGPNLPDFCIVDWPLLERRGYMLALAQGHNTYHAAYARHVVRELAWLKMNALYLYLENSFQFPFDPMLGGKRSMTPQQAEELDAYAASYGIEVIPMLNVLGHAEETLSLERYRHLAEIPSDKSPTTFSPSQFCPSNPNVLRFAGKMIAVLARCFRSRVIHVGGDEAQNLGQCPRCRRIAGDKGVAHLYANYFNAVARIAGKYHRRIGIWGDMLLNHRPGGAARERIHAADLLSKNIVIYDWHYSGGSRDTLRYFTGKGFEVIAATSTEVFSCNAAWPGQEVNQVLLLRDGPAAGIQGGLLTNWTNYMGAHDENFWLLVAGGADILWFCRGERRHSLMSAFVLQRYGLKGKALGEYIYLLGSTQGEMFDVFGRQNNANLRQTLYHTDNPLRFWKDYCSILAESKRRIWQRAIKRARALWRAVIKESSGSKDAYLPLLEAPLLVHEHLYQRYTMSVAAAKLYSAAAKLQNADPRACALKLHRAARLVEAHRRDFTPVITILKLMTKRLGTESVSTLRLHRTMESLSRLAALLRHLSNNNRPLPAFITLSDVFLERAGQRYWVAREDEWADMPADLARYSVTNDVWVWGPTPGREEEAL